MRTKKRIVLEPRDCECCNGSSLEPLRTNEFTAKTRNGSWHFSVNNVVCRSCGFVFVSPSPTADSLDKYYSDSYVPFEYQVLDYDAEKRIRFIKRHIRSRRLCLEVGGNNDSSFRNKLSSIFSKVSTVEPNKNVESDFRSLSEFPKNSADALLHYFVLEHIPKVREFLSSCYDALKAEGIMICEVPDIQYYQKDISALVLHEHTNHFSLKTLKRLAASIGFRLIGSSASLCSRRYGFAAAFTKTSEKDRRTSAEANEYRENKEYFLMGIRRLDRFQERLDKAFLKVEENARKGKRTVLWGANDRLLQFLSGKRSLPDNTIVVDSNLLKKNFSEKFRTYEPLEAANDIVASDLILIFTKLNSEKILDFIRKKFDKRFDKKKVIVLDF